MRIANYNSSATPETLKDVATEQTLGVLRGLYTMIGSHIVSMELTSNAMAASTSNQASLLDLSSGVFFPLPNLTPLLAALS